MTNDDPRNEDPRPQTETVSFTSIQERDCTVEAPAHMVRRCRDSRGMARLRAKRDLLAWIRTNAAKEIEDGSLIGHRIILRART